MVIAYLKALELTEGEILESLGQIIDCLVQSLEQIDKRMNNNPMTSGSLGDFQKLFDNSEGTETLGLKLASIRNLRKTIDINNPSRDMVNQLREAVIDFIRASDTEQLHPERRIRYKPELVNVTGLDSLFGFKQLKIFHGSVTHIPCDTLVISANISNGELEGQILNALRWRYDLKIESPTLLYEEIDSKILLVNSTHSNSPFKRVVILALTDKLNLLSTNQLKSWLQVLFASLCALEYNSDTFEGIALSFICGNRVTSKSEAVQQIVLESLKWLKQSPKCTTISCSLFLKSELELWNSSMDATLGRKNINTKDFEFVGILRQEIIGLLENVNNTSLQPATTPLRDALSNHNSLSIELICTFSRTLCELIVVELHKSANLKPSGDLLSNIERLRSEGIISPWISSYMHGIRILGNKSVHPAKSPPKYKPAELDVLDLTSSLIAVRCLLEFWGVQE
jgi:hypothetical protein